MQHISRLNSVINSAAQTTAKIADLVVVAGTATSAVRAELVGANYATALGVEAHSPSPVLALCRVLVERGHDPATPLEVYRGQTLALRVKSIGQAARLEVDGEGTGFRPATKPGRASPMLQNLEAAE